MGDADDGEEETDRSGVGRGRSGDVLWLQLWEQMTMIGLVRRVCDAVCVVTETCVCEVTNFVPHVIGSRISRGMTDL